MRPGCSDSSVPNCSAITIGAWFGSMIPPAPTRIVEVPRGDVGDHDGGRGAGDADRVVVLGEPEPPVAQALDVLARSSELRSASAGVAPSTIGARSRTENGGSGTAYGCLTRVTVRASSAGTQTAKVVWSLCNGPNSKESLQSEGRDSLRDSGDARDKRHGRGRRVAGRFAYPLASECRVRVPVQLAHEFAAVAVAELLSDHVVGSLSTLSANVAKPCLVAR